MNDKPIRILLIEDNPGDVRLMQEILGEGANILYELDCADRLSTGLDYLAKQQTDVVLLDLGLPDSQGLKTLSSILAQAPRVPIVVLTVLDDEALAIEAIHHGAEDYLIKAQVNGKLLWRGICYAIERKQAEEALRQSEEKYSTLVERGNDGIIIIQDGLLKFINSKMLEIAGFSLEEGLGKPFIDFVSPEYRRLVADRYKKRMSGEEITNKYEIEILTRDGERTPVEINASRIEYEGKPADMAIVRDITERKRAEEQLIMAGRLAAVGEMASGIAHEINNPLTGVIGFAQLLMRKSIPDDIRDDVRIINDGAQRVAGIVKRLLTFARWQKPGRDYVDINQIMGATLDMRAYEMETANIKVTTQLAPDLPMTMADSGQLQQVFLNIIVNAEMEMRLAHGRGSLLIKTETIGDTIRISFKDDGPGIARENLERIFEPFFTTRKVGNGTGLGLSICLGIIAEHKGQIYAMSRLGKGATFIVELPVVTEDKQVEVPKPTAGEAERPVGAKILVVDDEPAILQFLDRVLTDEGHEVETTDSADDALQRIENKRYSLILLDIKLPGMSGIELYNRIQKIAHSLARRVVFITGDVMGADTKEFLSKTKAPYIAKPFDTEQVKRDVNNVLTQGA